jgi:hypothetical protein
MFSRLATSAYNFGFFCSRILNRSAGVSILIVLLGLMVRRTNPQKCAGGGRLLGLDSENLSRDFLRDSLALRHLLRSA